MALGIQFVLLAVGVFACSGADVEPANADTVARISKLVDQFYDASHIRRAKTRSMFERQFELNNKSVRSLVHSIGISGDVQQIADNAVSRSKALWQDIINNLTQHFDDLADDSAKLGKEIRDAISPQDMQDPLVQTYLKQMDTASDILLKKIEDLWTEKRDVYLDDLDQFVASLWRFHAAALQSEHPDGFQDVFERLFGTAYDLLRVDLYDYLDQWLMQLDSFEKRNKALTIVLIAT